MGKEERWSEIGRIIEKVQTVVHRHHTWKDRLEDISVDPVWGAVLGIFILSASFYMVRLVGEGLINYLLDPLFSKLWVPLLDGISSMLQHEGLIHHILIGTLFNGAIDMEQSFGILSTGLYVPVVMVLPYVISFYGVLSFLEDWGYLPRMAVIFDALLHRLGLHGFAIVPALLGLGCNVPGIIATRVLESPRERFIAATLISVAVPCAGLQAMIIGVLGDVGLKYVLLVYISLLLAWVVIGRILHLFLPGYSPELIVEIPPYRFPSLKGLAYKLWFRTKGFLVEAIPLVMVGVLIVNLLYMSHLIDAIAGLLSPVFNGLLGLPAETAGPIMLGMLRKDVAVGMLVPLGLTPDQLVIATVTLAMTFPCIATFVVLWKELGYKKMFASLLIMIVSALTTGTILRMVLSLNL
jgi:ferrous iron transport protein B